MVSILVDISMILLRIGELLAAALHAPIISVYSKMEPAQLNKSDSHARSN